MRPIRLTARQSGLIMAALSITHAATAARPKDVDPELLAVGDAILGAIETIDDMAGHNAALKQALGAAGVVRNRVAFAFPPEREQP